MENADTDKLSHLNLILGIFILIPGISRRFPSSPSFLFLQMSFYIPLNFAEFHNMNSHYWIRNLLWSTQKSLKQRSVRIEIIFQTWFLLFLHN